MVSDRVCAAWSAWLGGWQFLRQRGPPGRELPPGWRRVDSICTARIGLAARLSRTLGKAYVGALGVEMVTSPSSRLHQWRLELGSRGARAGGSPEMASSGRGGTPSRICSWWWAAAGFVGTGSRAASRPCR